MVDFWFLVLAVGSPAPLAFRQSALAASYSARKGSAAQQHEPAQPVPSGAHIRKIQQFNFFQHG